ncbi:MAG: hypothetical protein EHM12_11540 [Dehalococcoidia bacterium]|nr:MAG: hypothetical protein EHM12_11540 [Dehalococcoidia bacterium]
MSDKCRVRSDEGQVSLLTHHVSRFTRQVLAIAARFRVVGILIILTLPALACGLTPPQYQMNNEVRLAVYEYERKVRGPTDDLVIDFQRDEPRLKFEGQNENGGRTVWLYRLGFKEFFDPNRYPPPEINYLYIQSIEYSANYQAAAVKVFRGDGQGFNGWQLTLHQDNDHHWAVTGEVEIEKSQ